MEEISTTSEVVQEQTTPEIPQEQTSESPAEETQEPEIVQTDETETEQPTEEKTEEKQTDWEKIAKDNQSSFTKSQQELAEYKRKVAELEAPKEPSIVDETGKISKDFQESYQRNIDNDEFLKYDSLSRSIQDLEIRQEVENILREAQSVYHYDKSAYAQSMDTLKQYFSPRIIEQITRDKILAEQQLNQVYQTELQKNHQEKVKNVIGLIESTPELKQLVDDTSEDYSPETFTIVKQLFDKYGTIDVELTKNAISSIKALGVKEHLAKEKLEATKQSATVPTGANVKVEPSGMPTAKDFAENPSLYTEAVNKYGMEKVDAIIAGKQRKDKLK